MKFILVTTMNIHIPSIHIFTAGSFSYSLTCQLALSWTGCPLASLWPEHRTKGWPILVSLKIPTLSHTHKLGQLLRLLKLHLYFYAVQEVAWSLSLQTALSLLVSPAFRPPVPEAGTSSASWGGTWWPIPWRPVTFSVLLAETRKQNNSTQCAATTDWLTGLLRNKQEKKLWPLHQLLSSPLVNANTAWFDGLSLWSALPLRASLADDIIN